MAYLPVWALGYELQRGNALASADRSKVDDLAVFRHNFAYLAVCICGLHLDSGFDPKAALCSACAHSISSLTCRYRDGPNTSSYTIKCNIPKLKTVSDLTQLQDFAGRVNLESRGTL